MEQVRRIVMRRFALGFSVLLLMSAHVQAQSVSDADLIKQDAELIKQTALDYIEGWYEGNAERMERARILI